MILVTCKKPSYVHFGEICKNIYPGADRLKFLTFVIPLPYSFYDLRNVLPSGVQVSKLERFHLSKRYLSHRSCNFSRHKSFASSWTFVIEQNTITSKHIVSLSKIDNTPVGEKLGHSIRRSGIKRCFFILRNLLNFAVKFGGRGLIEFDGFFEAAGFDSV